MKTTESIKVDGFKIESDCYYNITTLCNGLKTCRKTIYKMISNRDLRAVRVGKRYKVHGKSILLYFKKRGTVKAKKKQGGV